MMIWKTKTDLEILKEAKETRLLFVLQLIIAHKMINVRHSNNDVVEEPDKWSFQLRWGRWQAGRWAQDKWLPRLEEEPCIRCTAAARRHWVCRPQALPE